MTTPTAVPDERNHTTIVVGASRGFGHGVATAFADAGRPVVAVARSERPLLELARQMANVRPVVADAADPSVPGALYDRFQPSDVIIVAGAAPLMRPLHHHTWETFSANWNTDVRAAFHWLREALITPLQPGSRVIVVSSGAAINGSPLSGGYAGAKATQRFITGYAQEEARLAGLGLSFTTVLPQLTAATGLGLSAVQAYAKRAGRTLEAHLQQLGDQLTPEIAGAALLELARVDAPALASAYRLTAAGTVALP